MLCNKMTPFLSVTMRKLRPVTVRSSSL